MYGKGTEGAVSATGGAGTGAGAGEDKGTDTGRRADIDASSKHVLEFVPLIQHTHCLP